jgi:hypothetical protein
MPATPPVDPEIADVNGYDFAVPPFLAHRNYAGIGEIHWLIGVLANELPDTGMVFTQIPGADQQPIGYCRQDRSRIAEKVGCFRQNRFAGIYRVREMAEHIFRPRTKPWLVARERRNQRACVEQVNHYLRRPRRANARRMFALVGAGITTLAAPRCRSQGD